MGMETRLLARLGVLFGAVELGQAGNKKASLFSQKCIGPVLYNDAAVIGHF